MFNFLSKKSSKICPPLRVLSNNVNNKLWKTQHAIRFYRNDIRYQRFNSSNNGRGLSLTSIIYDKNSRKYVYYTLGGLAIFYVVNLKEAPISGRRQFIWIPEWLELKIGNYSYNSMINQYGRNLLAPNNALSRKVETIFYKVLDAALVDPEIDNSKIENIKWKIHIIDDPRAPPNAFVLPGGKVFVFTSILPICKNDDGLATVLSHEFAHQLARHTSENLSKAPIYSIIGLIMYSITGASSINSLLLDGLLRMPASRHMETEADYIGLMLMSRACFNPRESVKLWGRFSEFERRDGMKSNKMMEFLSTHPASDRRIENMNQWLPKAITTYENSNCTSTNSYYKGFTDSVFGTSFAGPSLGDGLF